MTGAASAEDAASDVMHFSMQDNLIIADGPIAPDTAQNFRAFLSEQGHAEGTWNTVMFVRSPGGALGAALDVGYELRNRGISVAAFELCASACTYMMMGGVNRVVTKDTRYGVHQFAFPDSQAEPDKPFFSARDIEEHQKMVADLTEYTDQMGVDAKLVIVASRTPPGDMTFLTREQLVAFKVDNVPSDDPAGQAQDNVRIPGVTETQVAETLSLEGLKISAKPGSIYESLTIKPGGIAGSVALGVARRLVMAEALDLPQMEEALANSYAFNVEFNGRVRSGEDMVAEKRRMVSEWGHRRRSIDDQTMQVTCQEQNLYCTVTGEYDSELGLTSDGFVSKARWRFAMDVMLPLTLPRVTSETLTQLR